MKKLISALVLSIVSMASHAYEGLGLFFPSEKTVDGLPYAIPCGKKEYVNGRMKTYSLQCAWYYSTREVAIWDDRRQQDVIYQNQYAGRCIKGNCKDNAGNVVGHWPEDLSYRLSIWYYIDQSTDGKPVAYRIDGGPSQGQDRIAYVEAGKLLQSFYEEAGMQESTIQHLFNVFYLGGATQYQEDLKGGSAGISVDPEQCLNAWIEAFRKDLGEDAMIVGEQLSEWEGWCSEGKLP